MACSVPLHVSRSAGGKVNQVNQRLLYEAGEPRDARKHHWNRSEAGVTAWRSFLRVGKCDARISDQDAEGLLNAGFRYSEPPGVGPFPDFVYAVRDGAPYEARPTRVGVSYHGYPVLPERFARLPRSVRNWL